MLSVLARRWRVAGIGRSVIASIVVVLFINEPELVNPIFGTAFASPLLAWPWLFPIGSMVCVGLSLRGRRLETV
jgi:hypothetical protein